MWALYALGAAVVWGLYYSVIEQSVRQLSIAGFMFISSALWTVMIALLALAFGVPVVKDFHTLIGDPKLLVWFLVAVVLGVVAQYGITTSVAVSNATLTSLVEITYPLFVVFFTWLIFGRTHFSWPVFVGAALIFSGVGVLVYFGK